MPLDRMFALRRSVNTTLGINLTEACRRCHTSSSSLWQSYLKVISAMAAGTCHNPFGCDSAVHNRPLCYPGEQHVWQEGNIQRARWLRMEYAPHLTLVTIHRNKEDG